MSWHSVRGHDRVVESLRPGCGRDGFRTPCSFVGPEGIGKRTFARKLAQALLCETRPDAELDPCGTCPGCLQVAGGHASRFHRGRASPKTSTSCRSA